MSNKGQWAVVPKGQWANGVSQGCSSGPSTLPCLSLNFHRCLYVYPNVSLACVRCALLRTTRCMLNRLLDVGALSTLFFPYNGTPLRAAEDTVPLHWPWVLIKHRKLDLM